MPRIYQDGQYFIDETVADGILRHDSFTRSMNFSRSQEDEYWTNLRIADGHARSSENINKLLAAKRALVQEGFVSFTDEDFATWFLNKTKGEGVLWLRPPASIQSSRRVF